MARQSNPYIVAFRSLVKSFHGMGKLAVLVFDHPFNEDRVSGRQCRHWEHRYRHSDGQAQTLTRGLGDPDTSTGTGIPRH